MALRRAFTLVELLVVIVIIAVLLVILMPVFMTARATAMRTTTMGNMMQISTAMMLYADDNNQRLAPSTNYGVAEDHEERMWTNIILRYTSDGKDLFVAKGSDARFAATWEERGWQNIGLTNATALDLLDGCYEGQKDTTGCQAFQSPVEIEKVENHVMVPLFSVTPHGPTEEGYRGFEFSPFNGLPRAKVKETPPLISDRDLVLELLVLPPDLIKALYARFNPDGRGNGTIPIVFGDGHARSYRSKTIVKGRTNIQWRFR